MRARRRHRRFSWCANSPARGRSISTRSVDDKFKVFVGGLPSHTKQADLQAHFSTFGEVRGALMLTFQRLLTPFPRRHGAPQVYRADLIFDKHHRPRNFAYVQFVTRQATLEAQRQRYQQFLGRLVRMALPSCALADWPRPRGRLKCDRSHDRALKCQ